VQYMAGVDYAGIRTGETNGRMNPGDPSMSLVAPVEQYRDGYTLAVPGYTENYVNVVAPVGTKVTIDGTAIDAGKLDVGQPITEDVLRSVGLIKNRHDGVKLLAKGEIKAKIIITVAGASKAAVDAVAKVGGQVNLPAPKAKPPTRGSKLKRLEAGKTKPKKAEAEGSEEGAAPKEKAKAKGKEKGTA